MLKIAVLGMSENTSSVFLYFVEKYFSEECQLVDPDDAQKFIVNFDSSRGKKQWKKLPQAKQRSAILVADTDPQKSGCLWLPKPLEGSKLVPAIRELIQNQEGSSDKKPKQHRPNKEPTPNTTPSGELPVEMPQAEASLKKQSVGYSQKINEQSAIELDLSAGDIEDCCGKQDDANYTDTKHIYYDDENTLLAPLKKAVQVARQEKCGVELSGASTSICIFPGGEEIYIELDDRVFRHFCIMPLSKGVNLQRTDVSKLQSQNMLAKNTEHIHPAESIIWKIALWTSRGRLPKDIKIDQAIKMQFWPDLTRLQITPYALRITSLWIGQSLSPLQVARFLEIPLRYVFAVASAAHSLEAISFENDDNRSVSIDSGRSSPNLFNNILRRLRIRG